ncbi:MAG: HD domain-containing protein [Deltaproteobacteria bacterium]|nr:HD domain-containing protein [Deltaproteobacteria bacterium]
MLQRDDLLALIARDDALSALLASVRARLDDDPAHDLAHCLRVALWAIELGRPLGVDPREAIAAALMHDVVNVPKDHPDRHRASELSADVVRAELPAFAFGPDAVARIADAVRDHSYSRGATPEGPLGRALQDADRLEALGALGLFRCISTGARMGARYFHDEDPWARDRPLDDRAYSLDHFFKKLLLLPDTMLTEGGRLEARRRAAFLEATIAAVAHELGVPFEG